MGWFWFIPVFHISEKKSESIARLILQRQDVDFPLGVGSAIVDVEIGMVSEL